ncbi:low-temperature-induced 65 kDa protein-like [Telopea speciosissima]|uniref:low-temperature-induced 65 kDa protein-like n=1 Tax=Telopea speciosissima TaxID=54955 RepID=UPI001CC5A3EC|nr:low-temperature-induced 65 kDa protein-like [Telopea speciosissima]
MAQMERMQRNRGSGGGTPRNTLTIEQLLSYDDAHSPVFHEEDQSPQSRKSVLAKMKEKTKRWRDTLAKKKQSSEDNATPAWGFSLEEEDDDQEGEPEYLGAPMYESEMAPEECREAARQHPRANPVISEKHMLATNFTTQNNSSMEVLDKDPPPHTKHFNDPVAQNKTLTQTVTDKLAPARAAVTANLAPAYATVSEATHQMASKINHTQADNPIISPTTVSEATHQMAFKINHTQADNPIISPSTADNTHTGSVAGTGIVIGTGAGAGSHQQQWDKGVSVKEYLTHKLEPGEEERALSQVITEAISPRKLTSGFNHEDGMVEKVREAVSSLLWTSNDSSPSSGSATKTTTTTATTIKTNPATNKASTNVPISTNAYSAVEEIEEQNKGRILQAN